MLNDVEVDHIYKLVNSVIKHGGSFCDMWFYKDMRLVVMFHVSNKDFTKGYDNQWPTYVCYTGHMMRDMWAPEQRARKVCNSVNVLVCPTLYAPLPTQGDTWCDYRGGASIITPGLWKIINVVKYCYKMDVYNFLRNNNFFCLVDNVRDSGEYIENALLGKDIGLKYEFSQCLDVFTSLYHRRKSYIKLVIIVKIILSTYKSFESETDWRLPIYISRDFAYLYIPIHDGVKWFYVRRCTSGVVCLSDVNRVPGDVITLQDYTRRDLLKMISSGCIITTGVKTKGRIYKSKYYDIIGTEMLQELIDTVEE